MHVMRWTSLAVLVASLWVGGCESLSDYRDPQALGKVPPRAKLCDSGCVGVGAKLGWGMQVAGPGTLILVAGEEPILTQAVAANDRVQVVIDHALLGDCSITLTVNGARAGFAASKIGAYRWYFVPADGDHAAAMGG